MNAQNTMKLEFLAIAENKEFAGTVVDFFIRQVDMSTQEMEDIIFSVKEIVDNVILHAYPNEKGKVTIFCRILKNDVLEIIVKDKGVGIKNVNDAMQTFFTTVGEEHCGLGFNIVKSFMTKVTVKSSMGKGTSVCMKKKIKRK